MTITRYIPSEKMQKERLLKIYEKYSENEYYRDCPKQFSELIIVIEDFPNNYLEKIENELIYSSLKEWIQSLFIIDKTTSIELSIENEIQFILNNIVELPFCKCKVKLKIQSFTSKT